MSPTAVPATFITRPVPSIAPPPVPIFQASWVARSQPVILRGLLPPDAPALRWTPDALASVYGDLPVPIARTADGYLATDPRRGVITDAQPLHQFFAQMRAPSPVGYMTVRTDTLPPELARDFAPPSYCDGAPWVVSKLWMSTPGTIARLHQDLADNLHVQIHGHKRFLLVDPQQSANVYPAGLLASMPNAAQVDLLQPDLVRFPRLAQVTVHVADLAPGDAIFLPSRWWHLVQSVAESVSVNWFFASGAWAGVVWGADVFKRVRGISR